jgi:hypothetical protein
MAAAGDKRFTEQEDRRQDERIDSYAPIMFLLFGNKFHRTYASRTSNHRKTGFVSRQTRH